MTANGTLVTAAVAVVVATSVVGVGAASAQSTPSEAFVVELDADGTATVELRQTFDLTTDSERAAFEELRDNETRTARLRGQFADGLRGIARATANETDRPMRIEEPSVAVTSTDSTGTLTLAATWDGLAATDGDRLVLREPFADRFRPDRPFVVGVPDGYELQTTAPAPDTTTDGRATWNADRDLTGFEVVAAPADDPESGTNGAGPGFGVGAALLAVALLALLGTRR